MQEKHVKNKNKNLPNQIFWTLQNVYFWAGVFFFVGWPNILLAIKTSAQV